MSLVLVGEKTLCSFRASRHRFWKGCPGNFSCFAPSDSSKCLKVYGQFKKMERKGFQVPGGAAWCAQHPCLHNTVLTTNLELCRRKHPYIPAVAPRSHHPPSPMRPLSHCPALAVCSHHHGDGPSKAVFLPEAPVLAVVRLRLPVTAVSRHLRSHRSGTCL